MYKTQTGGPSILSSPLFLHKGVLTVHYCLAVDCGLVQWPACQEKRVSVSYRKNNAFNIEMFSQLLSYIYIYIFFSVLMHFIHLFLHVDIKGIPGGGGGGGGEGDKNPHQLN